MGGGFTARLAATDASPAVLLIRLLAGGVFLVEGLKKFLFAAEWGTGRFAHIGIPFPELTGPFVGAVEIVCGALIPILMEHGFFAMEDPARTDYAMPMSLVFLLLVGAGQWSFDAWAGGATRA